MTEETMPLMIKRYQRSVPDLKGPDEMPMDALRPHAAQARSNHSQTLDGLKSRNGLSPLEALAIYSDLSYWDAKDKWSEQETLGVIAEMMKGDE